LEAQRRSSSRPQPRARTTQRPWWQRHPYQVGALLAAAIVSLLTVLAVTTGMYSVWEDVPTYASLGPLRFVAEMLFISILIVLPAFILTVAAMKAFAIPGLVLVVVETAIVARRVRGTAR
jgi:hypothetical protein